MGKQRKKKTYTKVNVSHAHGTIFMFCNVFSPIAFCVFFYCAGDQSSQTPGEALQTPLESGTDNSYLLFSVNRKPK